MTTDYTVLVIKLCSYRAGSTHFQIVKSLNFQITNLFP